MAEALESDMKKILALLGRLTKRDGIYDLYCSLSLTEPNVIEDYWRYNLFALTRCFQSFKDSSQQFSREQQEAIAAALELSDDSPLSRAMESGLGASLISSQLIALEALLKEQLTDIGTDNSFWSKLQRVMEWAEKNKGELKKSGEKPDWYSFADLLHECPAPEEAATSLRESILEACSKGFYCASVFMTHLSHYDEVLESDIDSAVLAALDERYAHCFQSFIVPLYNVMKAGTFTKAVQQIYFSPRSTLKGHAVEFYGAVKTPKETLEFLRESFFIDGEIDLETRIKFESFHIFLSELASREIALWQDKQANCVDDDREKLLETWGEEELAGYGTLMKKLDYVHRLYQIASEGMLDSFGQSEKILCPEVL